MTITRLDLQDREQFIDLINLYKDAIQEEHIDENSRKALLKAIQEQLIYFFVVKEQNEIIGMCSVCKTFSTYDCALSGIFEDFYIKPSFRHNGIARKLVNEVMNECRKEKIKSLWVGSAVVDIEMYKSLGFNISLGNLLAWNIE